MKVKDETLGMWLGVIGVTVFAITLPMTRLATGTQAAFRQGHDRDAAHRQGRSGQNLGRQHIAQKAPADRD